MVSFLFRAAKQYRSFDFEHLSSFFDLESKVVKKVVSKLILQSRLQAKIDLTHNLLLLEQQGQDIQELQQLSLQYVSQITTMVHQNERIVEILNHQQDMAGKAVKQKALNAEKAQAQQQQ